jgi:hypothetical protein
MGQCCQRNIERIGCDPPRDLNVFIV